MYPHKTNKLYANSWKYDIIYATLLAHLCDKQSDLKQIQRISQYVLFSFVLQDWKNVTITYPLKVSRRKLAVLSNDKLTWGEFSDLSKYKKQPKL